MPTRRAKVRGLVLERPVGLVERPSGQIPELRRCDLWVQHGPRPCESVLLSANWPRGRPIPTIRGEMYPTRLDKRVGCNLPARQRIDRRVEGPTANAIVPFRSVLDIIDPGSNEDRQEFR